MITEHFHHCPRCGGSSVEPQVPVQCQDCGFVLYLNPAPSAVALLHNEAGEVLLIQRGREPKKGAYALPGGFIDFGETAEEAVRREVREELNLEIGELAFLGSFLNEYTYKDVTYRVLDFYFTAPIPPLENLRLEQGEITDHRICRPTEAEIEALAFVSNQGAVRRFLGGDFE